MFIQPDVVKELLQQLISVSSILMFKEDSVCPLISLVFVTFAQNNSQPFSGLAASNPWTSIYFPAAMQNKIHFKGVVACMLAAKGLLLFKQGIEDHNLRRSFLTYRDKTISGVRRLIQIDGDRCCNDSTILSIMCLMSIEVCYTSIPEMRYRG